MARPRADDPIGSGSAVPGPVAGMLAWYKADAITGHADGSSLTTWPDSSGNGYDAVQGSFPSAPIYYSSTAGAIVNGLPAVWNAAYPASYALSGLVSPAFGSPPSVGMVYCVGGINSFDSALTYTLLWDGAVLGNRWALIDTNANGVYPFAGTTPTGYGSSFQGPPTCFTAIYSGGATSALRLGGVEYLYGINVGAESFGQIILLNDYLVTNSPRNFMAELLVYPSVHNALQIAQTEYYLMNKYNLT